MRDVSLLVDESSRMRNCEGTEKIEKRDEDPNATTRGRASLLAPRK